MGRPERGRQELHDLLESLGVSVWFSEKDVVLGTGLLREIDKGLVRSRVGIVLVTPALLRRLEGEGIADKELSVLLARDLLVPIVHDTTYDALREVSPMLASRSAPEHCRRYDGKCRGQARRASHPLALLPGGRPDVAQSSTGAGEMALTAPMYFHIPHVGLPCRGTSAGERTKRISPKQLRTAHTVWIEPKRLREGQGFALKVPHPLQPVLDQNREFVGHGMTHGSV